MSDIRCILADNASPMTLDGTRTYIIGHRQVAVIDPGPNLPAHIDAVAAAIGDGVAVTVLVTHAHPDHSDGAQTLAARFDTAPRRVIEGTEIETDAGTLRAIATPGHTPDHFVFHLPARAAVFCGDMMMGGLDTALVALPEGDLQAYLTSLEKIRALQCTTIYPAHGEPFTDPDAAIERYVRHRLERVQQVTNALQAGPARAEDLVDRIYGRELDPRLRVYAADAVLAYLAYLQNGGMVQHTQNVWSLV
ncbi:MAG TPA: MBL fold metallo-hydrolase [Longimicrobiales bacterium]